MSLSEATFKVAGSQKIDLNEITENSIDKTKNSKRMTADEVQALADKDFKGDFVLAMEKAEADGVVLDCFDDKKDKALVI